MAQKLIEKLLVSFEALEKSIEVTHSSLRKKTGIPVYIMEHVEQYRKIVSKQRLLAEKLEYYMELQDWAEVTRHVKLINGLSSMIRDDAQALLNGDEPAARTELRSIPIQ